MKKAVDELIEWFKQINDFSLPPWEQLPEMDLYMDQVMSYLKSKLEPAFVEDIDKIITPYMINNYVKANLITPPTSKKYSKEQIGYLLGVCSVKQVLSINDILFLFRMDKNISEDKSELYTFFRDIQNQTIRDANAMIDNKIRIIEKRYNDEIKRADGNDEALSKANDFAKANLAMIAFRLAVEAEVKKVIADRILSTLQKEETFKLQNDDASLTKKKGKECAKQKRKLSKRKQK